MKILCMGECLLRYSTKKGKRFSSLQFDLNIGGAEGNVALSLASWGNDTSYLTKLSANPIGDAIVRLYKSRDLDTSYILRGPERMGAYYLETGSGNRASSVIYDRANSAFALMKKEEVNIEETLKDVDLFIVSGITVALSNELKELVMDMMKYCQRHHIKVAYDVNYRAKLWSVEEARKALLEILPYVNYLSAGKLDATGFLNLTSTKEDELLDYYQQIIALYPNIEVIFSSNRILHSTSNNDYQALLYTNDQMYTSRVYHVDDIVDRIGTGDAFFAGVMHGLANHKDPQYTVEFAAVSAELKHSIEGDINDVSVDEVERFIANGVSRVNR